MQFVKIPKYFFYPLRMLDYLVYTNMKRWSNKDGTCFISLKIVAKECQTNISTIRKSIERLIKFGYLRKIIKGDLIFYQFSSFEEFEKIPIGLLDNNNLSPLEKSVIIALFYYIVLDSPDYGSTINDYRDLARLIHCTTPVICKVFKNLINKGYVTIHPTGLKHPNTKKEITEKRFNLTKLCSNNIVIKKEDNKRRRFKELFEEMLKLDCVH